MFKLVQVELRRQMLLARSYIVSHTADHFFFVIGFLILAGLFNMATDGAYRGGAPLISLIGYVTWRVAAAILRDLVRAFAHDAQWGTLEQIWLTGSHPVSVILARAVALVLFYTVRILLIALFIIVILQIPIHFPLHILPGAALLYLLTLAAPLGLALILIGMQLVFKNVEALAFPLATILLFLTGALSPLADIPVLYTVSRFLPIAIGVDLLRELLVHGLPLRAVVFQPAFLALLLNSAIYLALGGLVMNWARTKVLAHGSLAHY
jgi:ABC-2 type transport system permease protein